ncbi:hypothetical protein [Singulisphaera acidiphila]|uniref:Uncharacterized protein n=1 Tax=Singulisphaera acidiphila (strain ATCC BAA-1392 / DSM 18658 / VKM B-2454 / MOB10) TaxID=886293 RepID=H1MW64_SINAD|nr:hypothetical protein [Singulisphaera acidiphila]AGA28475.1 hypothetical protein Sinac_4276 [Singulisphaera acidiphila DSM 18658]
MRVPKIRIRTWMIVVAVVGLGCSQIANNPSIGIILAGPLIGSPLIGLRMRNRLHGFLVGGIVGSLAETGLLVFFREPMTRFIALVIGPARTVDAPWPLANVAVGFMVGLAFGVAYLMRAAIVSPAYIVDSSAMRIKEAPKIDPEWGANADLADHPR